MNFILLIIYFEIKIKLIKNQFDLLQEFNEYPINSSKNLFFFPKKNFSISFRGYWFIISLFR